MKCPVSRKSGYMNAAVYCYYQYNYHHYQPFSSRKKSLRPRLGSLFVNVLAVFTRADEIMCSYLIVWSGPIFLSLPSHGFGRTSMLSTPISAEAPFLSCA